MLFFFLIGKYDVICEYAKYMTLVNSSSQIKSSLHLLLNVFFQRTYYGHSGSKRLQTIFLPSESVVAITSHPLPANEIDTSASGEFGGLAFFT